MVVVTTHSMISAYKNASAYGLVCELGMVLNTLYGAQNELSLSFATPTGVRALPNVVMCLGAPGVNLQGANIVLKEVTQHELRTGTASKILEPLAGWGPETLALPDVLANDAYYATSYRHVRYDDFAANGAGASLVRWGHSFEPHGNRTRAMSDNCVVLSMSSPGWRADSIYNVTVALPNPVQGDGAANATATVDVWLGSLDEHEAGVGYSTLAMRGPKYGTRCGTMNVSTNNTGSAAPIAGSWAKALAAANSTRSRSLRLEGSSGGTDGLTSLAKLLCAKYTTRLADMLADKLSDQIVPSMMWRAYLEDAAALVDETLVRHANNSLWPRLLDGRRPALPTREHGLAGLCASGWSHEGCRADSTFKDFRSGEVHRVFGDQRYRSMYTFHLIGETLLSSRAALSCSGLVVPRDTTNEIAAASATQLKLGPADMYLGDKSPTGQWP